MTRKLSLALCLLALAAASLHAQEAVPADGGAVTGRTVFDTFKRGGPLMWPILLCSVVALAFVIERAVSLRASLIFPRPLYESARSFVANGQIEQAVEACVSDRSPFARLLHACLARADTPGFEMEAAIEEAGARALYDLRRNARPLGIIGDISPLLGLMGTVLGMIKAFEVVARTGALGRTEMLAEGIGEALLTTAFGLLVAVPAIIFYHYFRAKAEGLLRAMEDACIDLLTELRRQRKTP